MPKERFKNHLPAVLASIPSLTLNRDLQPAPLEVALGTESVRYFADVRFFISRRPYRIDTPRQGLIESKYRLTAQR